MYFITSKPFKGKFTRQISSWSLSAFARGELGHLKMSCTIKKKTKKALA
jgi:hypothetical protein